MCRHLGYLGPPAPVGELLTRGPYSLRTQSWAPRDMRRGGTINADGFGVAWWPDPTAAPGNHPRTVRDPLRRPTCPEPAGPLRVSGPSAPLEQSGPGEQVRRVATRYRNSAPIWTDPAVDEVLPQLSSTAVLAAVRSATIGMPVERSACAPFIDGRWAFSHNGVISDWRTVLLTVAKQFGSPDLLEAESVTDSAALWVIVRAALAVDDYEPDRLGEAAAVSAWDPPARTADSGPEDSSDDEWPTLPDSAVLQRNHTAEALRRVSRAVLECTPEARLNLLLSDGATLWATAVHHSLSALVTDDTAVLASEPYDDDPRWQPIADRQLVTARPGRLTVTPLYPDPRAESDEFERART